VTGHAQGPAPAASGAGTAGPGCPADLRPGERIAGPHGHVCLACGCRIAQGLTEVRVPMRGRRAARYRHADGDGCADALRAPQPNNSLIGRYEALPTFQWDQHRGPAASADRSASTQPGRSDRYATGQAGSPGGDR
jgi:hypothetical protein